MKKCDARNGIPVIDSEYVTLVFANVVVELLDQKEFVTRSDIMLALEERKQGETVLLNIACDYALELLEPDPEIEPH